jgi:hypothetical protein
MALSDSAFTVVSATMIPGLRVHYRLRVVGGILAPFAGHQPRLRLLRV